LARAATGLEGEVERTSHVGRAADARPVSAPSGQDHQDSNAISHLFSSNVLRKLGFSVCLTYVAPFIFNDRFFPPRTCEIAGPKKVSQKSCFVNGKQ
jgi:hypothetical protein